MRPIGCPETSVMKYHYSLCNNPEERSSHLLRGGSLKARKVRHATAIPAFSSDETVQTHDLTTPFHFKMDKSPSDIHIWQNHFIQRGQIYCRAEESVSCYR
jgi:hypothetical protein